MTDQGTDSQPGELREARRIRIEGLDHPHDGRERLRQDVREGLLRCPKQLPPKYFYDARGSLLFEAITRTDEYYPTRTETAILERSAGELLAAVRPVELVEIGSGSSRKTQLLLEALHALGGDRYVPLDVSVDALEDAVERLSALYPWLEIHGLVGDFDHGLPELPDRGRRLVCFLGSTIGNLEGEERLDFLRSVRRLLQSDDAFLLGLDLIKDAALLEAAYDDAEGVTAAFNKNVLRVLDRELEADFDEDDFRHVAVWNAERSRMEMHLEALRALRVHIGAMDLTVPFAAGERMRTEISCKFERAGVERELAAAGLALERWLTDPDGLFALALIRRA